MPWYQQHLQLPRFSPGLHAITEHVLEAVPEVADCRVGLLHVYIQHTSASLTINEGADPDVPGDIDRLLDKLAPEDFPYRHTIEGPDDMPGHAKASLLGSSVSVPVCNGRLALGTWQGIFLCEHRRHAAPRRLVVTLHGERKQPDR